ncbi:helix-turn-helix domain-containing protein [Weissella paramesenteroides]|uniref:helix-turn-helix domain-containing protein n=1 Tax=Weissella paramesenteroides TaxID=1249 RepID=UPI002E7BD089|nr:helix-turn-helix transcriptional regulator [Weissella paramesenteroides]WPQ68519.1 helix-turn-helix transcriptional regulator [Weissella paramesenteroides]
MNRIKELRTKKGLTLQKLGKDVGISFGALGNYENERREPKLATWKKLADYFGVTVGYLQGISNIKSRQEDYKNDSFFQDMRKKLDNTGKISEKDKEKISEYILADRQNNAPNILYEIGQQMIPKSKYTVDDFDNLKISSTGITTIDWIIELVANVNKPNKKGQIISEKDTKDLLAKLQREIILTLGYNIISKSDKNDSQKNNS